MSNDHLAARAAETTATTRLAETAPRLVLATACPRCGAAVPSEASDFCEQCSAHLYPGHCVFCLEPFSLGQAHCRRCGLPPEGVVCGACATFSRFDFCPNPDCGAGLTPRAAEEIARLEHDPEVVDAFAELDEIAAVLAAVETDTAMRQDAEAELLPLAATAAAAPPVAATASAQSQPSVPAAASPTSAAAPAATPALSSPSLTSPAATTAPPRPSLTALRAAASHARSAEEKARVRALAQQAAQDALQGVSTRPFPSAQEARAAGTALQVALRCRVVTEQLEIIAWRCNRFNCEHPEPGGMSLCSDPSSGGVPIMRVITQVDDRSAEFTA